MVIKSIKKHKGGLRKQVIGTVAFSLLVASLFTFFSTVTINAILVNSESETSHKMLELTNKFTEELAAEIEAGETDFSDYENWDGWQGIKRPFSVSLFDENDMLLYERGIPNKEMGFTHTVSRPIAIIPGAYIVVSANSGPAPLIMFGISFLLGVVVFVVTFTLKFRKIEKYTYEIADGIGVLAGGELDYEIPVRGNTELSMLSTNINDMARALKQQQAQKQKSDNAREELIINVAHDLRTPITVLEGYLSMMTQEEDAEKHREYLEISLKKCKDLSTRANHIFEFVRLNSESEKYELKDVNASGFISQRFEEIAMVLAQEETDCNVDMHLSKALHLNIDKLKTQRVFDNLLSNILKYADLTQPVTLGTEVHGEHILVSLSNRTLHPLCLDESTMFERAVSGDKSRSSGSAGFGLSICKVIMRAQKGDICAVIDENTVTFTLTFPIKA